MSYVTRSVDTELTYFREPVALLEVFTFCFVDICIFNYVCKKHNVRKTIFAVYHHFFFANRAIQILGKEAYNTSSQEADPGDKTAHLRPACDI